MKIIIWILWLLLVMGAAAAGFMMLMFALWAPDHAIATAIANKRIATIVGGLAFPFVVSLGFMIKSSYGWGMAFALGMLPFMFMVAAIVGI